jgi:hypothetical protein
VSGEFVPDGGQEHPVPATRRQCVVKQPALVAADGGAQAEPISQRIADRGGLFAQSHLPHAEQRSRGVVEAVPELSGCASPTSFGESALVRTHWWMVAARRWFASKITRVGDDQNQEIDPAGPGPTAQRVDQRLG